jgi:hypothetical protein
LPRQRIVLFGLTAAVALAAVALALVARETGEERRPDLTGEESGADAGVDEAGIDDAATLAIAPARGDDYACTVPDLSVLRDPRCDAGEPYPACRWQLPNDDAAHGLYVVWRNTTPEHRWARPGLVTLVLAAAHEYQARWPGEHLTIGDLDAAGPRHQTHDRGVDVDLYLEHAMLDVNEGPHAYVENYVGRSDDEVRGLRDRVMDLARILATCARGRLRIYYNDPEIVTPFVAWFAEHGFVSDVGPAMMMHNRLHRFHFHMTVPEDLAPLGDPARAPSTETTPGGTE